MNHNPQHSITPTLRCSLLLVAGCLALNPTLSATAQEPPKITHDWPGYTGPEGTYADQSKVPLLDDFSRAKLLWISEHDGLGYGKTSSARRHAYGSKSKPGGSVCAYFGESFHLFRF